MDQGTATDFIEDLMQQIGELEERFRTVETTTRNLREQLALAREARLRWEATANILAGELQNEMGIADMFRKYERHVIHWAWEQTSGDD